MSLLISMLGILFIVGGTFWLGIVAHETWMEMRHDCLPHDPAKCRYQHLRRQ